MVKAAHQREVGQIVPTTVGPMAEMVHLQMASAVAAGNLTSVLIARFNLAPPDSTHHWLAAAKLLDVAIAVGDHGLDVGVAAHPSCSFDRDSDRLIEAVAVSVDLATSGPTAKC